MKNRFSIVLMTLGVVTILLSGCGKVPQAEIDSAKLAIEEAKTAGADIYLQENFTALQDSMNAVVAEIETENSNFFKNFSVQTEKLTAILAQAGQVKTDAIAKKEEVKAQVQTTIIEIQALVDSGNALILEAPKGKEGATALEAIKAELETISASIAELNVQDETTNYLLLLDKANASKEKGTAINTELTDVIEKYKANAKGRK